MLRWILCAVLVMAAAASAVPAGAQPSSPDLTEAASLYRSAEQAMADKRYDDAARDYGAAYEISKDAILFFKIASALDKAGKCPVAITYYRRYLREGKPSADHQKLTGERITACEGKASAAPPPPANPPSTDKAPPASDKAPPASDKAPPASDKAPATPSAPADKDKAKSPTPPSTSGDAKAPATPTNPSDKPADKAGDTKTGTKAGDKPADPKTKPDAKNNKAGGSTSAAGATSEVTPTDPTASDLAAAPTSSDAAAPTAATTEPTADPIAEPTSELANVAPPPSDSDLAANPDNAFTAPASDTPAPTYPPPSLRRTGAWLAVGAGIAFATVGTVLALSAESTEDDLADLYLTRAGEAPQEFDRATQDRYDTLVERGDRYQLLSWVSFAAAAATAGVATYLFLTSSSPSSERADEPKALALRPVLTHQSAGVHAAWAF